jgi:alkyldihydroxyacetonephosphate synthase
MSDMPGRMKWWGWGQDGVGFDAVERPGVWRYVSEQLGIVGDGEPTPPVSLDSVPLPAARRNNGFVAEIGERFGADALTEDRAERIVHAYGKGFRDLLRLRTGAPISAPDAVAYPDSEDAVVALVTAAKRHEIVLIPFGGGSNITGCIERLAGEARMVVSVDMARMRRVLSVDRLSGMACIEAGVFGPDLEAQLAAQGVTLGHFPDSFRHSTLGGWIATRSAGMQSDRYGKIEDMVIALRMVTPSGTIVSRTVPKSSNGIDIRHLCIGSEGTLGIITEATMQVYAKPERREIRGYIFPDFERGVAALHECVVQECQPSMARLNDANKTALSMSFKTRQSPTEKILSALVKTYLARIKGFDLPSACLMLTCYEGNCEAVRRQVREVGAIYRRFGAVDLGTGPGRSFEVAKYDFPHTRDFLMDRNVLADVSETAGSWNNLLPLYRASTRAIGEAIAATGKKGWVGGHISHTYRTGASLYFTFGCEMQRGREMAQYQHIKRAAEDSFMANGGTLSHHHGVGLEHLPWLAEDISAPGVAAVAAVKHGLDPADIMNPGRLLPSAAPIEGWETWPGDQASKP